MTLRSMRVIPEHDCDEGKALDIDICSGCGEHSGFCSVCDGSSCCGSVAVQTDPGYAWEDR